MVGAGGADPMMPNVALMIITDGRWDYMKDTLESAFEFLDWPFEQCVLVDDSGEGRRIAIPGWEIIQNPERKGLAGAIQAGWDALNDNIEYVFHLEDDFVFSDMVPIGADDLRARRSSETCPGCFGTPTVVARGTRCRWVPEPVSGRVRAGRGTDSSFKVVHIQSVHLSTVGDQVSG